MGKTISNPKPLGHRFDHLRGGWVMICPEFQEVTHPALDQVISISPIAGVTDPPLMKVDWQCLLCEQEHSGMLNTRDLDWAPFCDFYLMPEVPILGISENIQYVVDFQFSDLPAKTARCLQAGKWPFMLPCRTEEYCLRPAYPSQIRHMEHHMRKSLVSHRCSHCDIQQEVEVNTSLLTLGLLP